MPKGKRKKITNSNKSKIPNAKKLLLFIHLCNLYDYFPTLKEIENNFLSENKNPSYFLRILERHSGEGIFEDDSASFKVNLSENKGYSYSIAQLDQEIRFKQLNLVTEIMSIDYFKKLNAHKARLNFFNNQKELILELDPYWRVFLYAAYINKDFPERIEMFDVCNSFFWDKFLPDCEKSNSPIFDYLTKLSLIKCEEGKYSFEEDYWSTFKFYLDNLLDEKNKQILNKLIQKLESNDLYEFDFTQSMQSSSSVLADQLLLQAKKVADDQRNMEEEAQTIEEIYDSTFPNEVLEVDFSSDVESPSYQQIMTALPSVPILSQKIKIFYNSENIREWEIEEKYKNSKEDFLHYMFKTQKKNDFPTEETIRKTVETICYSLIETLKKLSACSENFKRILRSVLSEGKTDLYLLSPQTTKLDQFEATLLIKANEIESIKRTICLLVHQTLETESFYFFCESQYRNQESETEPGQSKVLHIYSWTPPSPPMDQNVYFQPIFTPIIPEAFTDLSENKQQEDYNSAPQNFPN